MTAISFRWLALLIIAYLLGSIPTALWVTHWLAKKDVRTLGDGNMGARNVSHVLGWWPAALVAVVDVLKGMLAIHLGYMLGMEGLPLYTLGVSAVIGHDYSILAGFRGGQGMATTIGVCLVLLPLETLIGLALFGALYLVLRNFNVSAGGGLGTLVLLAWLRGQPPALVFLPIALLLSIPLKKWADRGRVPEQPMANGQPPVQPNGNR